MPINHSNVKPLVFNNDTDVFGNTLKNEWLAGTAFGNYLITECLAGYVVWFRRKEKVGVEYNLESAIALSNTHFGERVSSCLENQND